MPATRERPTPPSHTAASTGRHSTTPPRQTALDGAAARSIKKKTKKKTKNNKKTKTQKKTKNQTKTKTKKKTTKNKTKKQKKKQKNISNEK